MLNSKLYVKCNFGEFIAIGAKPKDIEPLQFSLFNFSGINSVELCDLGDSNTFRYLLVAEADYIRARAKNMVLHLEYNYKGCNGKLPWKIATGRAKRELAGMKTEPFLYNETFIDINYNYMKDLYKEI